MIEEAGIDPEGIKTFSTSLRELLAIGGHNVWECMGRFHLHWPDLAFGTAAEPSVVFRLGISKSRHAQ